MGKFLLSGVGFAIAFTLVNPLDVLLLFSIYIALTFIQWIQLATIKLVDAVKPKSVFS
jgi:hypothetical protein